MWTPNQYRVFLPCRLNRGVYSMVLSFKLKAQVRFERPPAVPCAAQAGFNSQSDLSFLHIGHLGRSRQ